MSDKTDTTEKKPAEKKKLSAHDEQTNHAADSIRAILSEESFRAGNTQRDMDALRDKLKALADNLEEQGKSEDEIEEIRQQRQDAAEVVGKTPTEIEALRKQREEDKKAGKSTLAPDPNKSTAELLRETIDNDDEAKQNLEGKNISSPGKPVDSKVDLGKPAITSQASTKDRDAVEKAAKAGDDATRDAAKKK